MRENKNAIEKSPGEFPRRTRNMFLAWMALVLAALLIVGLNLYQLNQELLCMRSDLRDDIGQVKAFLNSEGRLEMLEMLLNSFYLVKSVRVPLDIVLADATYQGGLDGSEVSRVDATLSREASHVAAGAIHGTIEHRVWPGGANSITVAIRDFRPAEQLWLPELERYQYLHVRITLQKSTEPAGFGRLENPYTYTGYLRDTRINGVRLFEGGIDESAMGLDRSDFPHALSWSFDEDGGKAVCNLVYKVTGLFENATCRYREMHRTQRKR